MHYRLLYLTDISGRKLQQKCSNSLTPCFPRVKFKASIESIWYCWSALITSNELKTCRFCCITSNHCPVHVAAFIDHILPRPSRQCQPKNLPKGCFWRFSSTLWVTVNPIDIIWAHLSNSCKAGGGERTRSNPPDANSEAIIQMKTQIQSSRCSLPDAVFQM